MNRIAFIALFTYLGVLTIFADEAKIYKGTFIEHIDASLAINKNGHCTFELKNTSNKPKNLGLDWYWITSKWVMPDSLHFPYRTSIIIRDQNKKIISINKYAPDGYFNPSLFNSKVVVVEDLKPLILSPNDKISFEFDLASYLDWLRSCASENDKHVLAALNTPYEFRLVMLSKTKISTKDDPPTTSDPATSPAMKTLIDTSWQKWVGPITAKKSPSHKGGSSQEFLPTK